MSNCNNQPVVNYQKLDNAIEELSKGKTHWEDGLTSDIDANYNIWLDCDVHRTYNGATVTSQKLNIKEYLIFDKLTGLPAYKIEFDPDTLKNLFNI